MPLKDGAEFFNDTSGRILLLLVKVTRNLPLSPQGKSSPESHLQ